MRSESQHRGRHHREGRHGAKTFRRGRALAFYNMMNIKSNVLKKQLETPELQSINPILVGELKEVETLMEEFSQLFELYEVEETETPQGINNEDKTVDTEG